MGRETSVLAKSDKQGLIDSVPVRESPFIVPHPRGCVCLRKNFSETSAMGRLKGGCGQDWPPHIEIYSYLPAAE